MDDYLTHLNDYRRAALSSYKGPIILIDLADTLNICRTVQDQLSVSLNEDDIINTVMLAIESKENYKRRLRSKLTDLLLACDISDEWADAQEVKLINNTFFRIAQNMIGTLDMLGLYDQQDWLTFEYVCRDTMTDMAFFTKCNLLEFTPFDTRPITKDLLHESTNAPRYLRS